MPYASAKFVPKLWLVPACSALPSCIMASSVMEACEKLFEELKAADIRVKLDDRDTVSAGYKFAECRPAAPSIRPPDFPAAASPFRTGRGGTRSRRRFVCCGKKAKKVMYFAKAY